MLAWQHYNYFVGYVQVGRKVLRLNLDETSLCLWQGRRKGNVFIWKKGTLGRAAGVSCDHAGVPVADGDYM